MQRLLALVESKRKEWITLTPAFQWAQGFDDINMNVKFSHKWDTPATLDCKVHEVKLEPTIVHVDIRW